MENKKIISFLQINDRLGTPKSPENASAQKN